MQKWMSLVVCVPAAVMTPQVYAQDQQAKPFQVVRLDQAFDQVLQAAPTSPTQSDINRLAQVIAEHQPIYARLGHNAPKLYAKIAFSNHEIAQDNVRTRVYFSQRDLTQEVKRLRQKTIKTLGIQPRYPTVYYLAYGYRRGTNAQTQSGATTKDGKTHVHLNLVALARQRHWESAIVHETIHTLQKLVLPKETTLLTRTMLEGVPTYLAQAIQGHLSDADAMFWSPEQWQAAEKHRQAIIQAFAQQRHVTDPQQMTTFLQLHKPLQSVPGAPDRTGYYVGFLAVKAWVRQNPERPLQELLSVSPKEFWQALEQDMQNISVTQRDRTIL